ncbi:hypothetical protein PCANC_19064 [Puccinia coronata f. sp. avenae]|uniref:Uncharacterized protein n=1 Tax=Puccinia coronata f. sp. avenae TaxID=200324 RepID=A0A2N5UCZ2_9BASI|nr:hypothetical protein PCANC_19064 [Puccinia coronata f. sp. avenae]
MNRTNYHYIYGAAFGRGCLGRQPDVPGGFNGERLAFGFKNRSQTFICCRGVASRSSLLPAEKQPLLFSGMIARPREESQVGKIKDLIQVNRSAD